MTITVSSLTAKAALLLQDDGYYRWKLSELVGWLNDGQKEIVLLRPEAVVKTGLLLMTADSSRQSLPSDAVQLVDVTFDASKGSAVSQIDRSLLAHNQQWQTVNDPSDGGVAHYVYDPRNPLVYWVYPRIPAGQTRYLEVSYVYTPAEATSDGNITVPDVFAPALVNYMTARALAKDSESGMPPLAAAYYQAFLSLVSGAKAFSPITANTVPSNASFNPNTSA